MERDELIEMALLPSVEDREELSIEKEFHL